MEILLSPKYVLAFGMRSGTNKLSIVPFGLNDYL